MTLRARLWRLLERWYQARRPSKYFAERHGSHLRSFDARYADARQARRRGR